MRPKLETGALYDKIVRLMETRRLYLKKDLSRDDVAREATTNRTYVTRALRGRGQNFTQFVNSFRVQHALELLFDGKQAHLSREDIAELSGFTCADSMNRCLKKSAGSTACAVRERMRES